MTKFDALRQLQRDLTVGSGAQTFDERRRQTIRRAGRRDSGMQQTEDAVRLSR